MDQSQPSQNQENEELNSNLHTDDHLEEDPNSTEVQELQEGPNNSGSKQKSETWEWIKALGIAIIIALVIRISLFAPIVVDGTSMVPTLHHKERLIVNKAVYWLGEPKRGDILVFHAEMNKDWIKRVIGEPGDVVEMKNDQLYINGEMVDEPYLDEVKAYASSPYTNDFREEVPEGHIFVMGDNRQNSRDSRMIGPIPIKDVVGRADIVFWPLSEFHFVK